MSQNGQKQKSPFVRVQSLKNQAVIADRCFVARRFFHRLKGLIGRKKLDPGEAMFFPRNNDIHMWFMSIPIDVVFVRREKLADGTIRYRVTSVHENVKPWRVLPLRDGRASETLELPSGIIRKCGISNGDELCIN